MASFFSERPLIREDTIDYEADLLYELKSLLAAHGITSSKLAATLDQVRQASYDKKDKGTPQDARSNLLRLILWKLFGHNKSIWINPQTQAGNPVATEVLIEAYFMWNKALKLAEKCGIDPAAAADALAKATYATADQIEKHKRDSNAKGIGDVHKYLFVSYMRLVCLIASKQGLNQTDLTDFSEWIIKNDVSDNGAFVDFLNCGIMYQEFLDTLDLRGKNIAVARYSFGYSWQETAGELGIPMKSAQNILSCSVRNAVGICKRELQRVGYQQGSHDIGKMEH
jgi:hypothetical protein